jgi:ABC-type multidrug transport system fused ATPase/permease subunit
LENAQLSLAGAERVLEILDSASEVTDKHGAIELPPVHGHIHFENVSFRYIDEKPVLENISFEVKSGQTLALVGPTGVGKTTIIQLAVRFYDPTVSEK